MKNLNAIIGTIKNYNKIDNNNFTPEIKHSISNTLCLIERLGDSFITNLVEYYSTEGIINLIWMNKYNETIFIEIKKNDFCYFFSSKYDNPIYKNHVNITDDSISEFISLVIKINNRKIDINEQKKRI